MWDLAVNCLILTHCLPCRLTGKWLIVHGSAWKGCPVESQSFVWQPRHFSWTTWWRTELFKIGNVWEPRFDVLGMQKERENWPTLSYMKNRTAHAPIATELWSSWASSACPSVSSALTAPLQAQQTVSRKGHIVGIFGYCLSQWCSFAIVKQKQL